MNLFISALACAAREEAVGSMEATGSMDATGTGPGAEAMQLEEDAS